MKMNKTDRGFLTINSQWETSLDENDLESSKLVRDCCFWAQRWLKIEIDDEII